MRIYEIFDEENKLYVGTLLYYDHSKTFIIELMDNLDEWTCPLLFTSYVKSGIYTIPRDISKIWVQERIIPSGRQNIGSILKTHKLKEYDEIKFLELSHGRCSQDALAIKKIDILPEYVSKRMSKNLTDCTTLDNYSIMCFFADGKVNRINLPELDATPDVSKVVGNTPLFESCKIGPDGYYITFNDSLDIPATNLYIEGQTIPVRYEDFLSFVKHNTMDTNTACEELQCSRQNLAYIVKQKGISPIEENVKGNLYLKKDLTIL